MKTTEQIAAKLLITPPSEWSQALACKWTPTHVSEWSSLVRHLEGVAERASMLAEYITTRTGVDGCGEKDHNEAVKRANKRLVKVRRALGYTYPDRGTFTF